MITDFIFGTVKLHFQNEKAPEVFSVISRYIIPFTDSQLHENSSSIKIPLLSYRKIKKYLPQEVISEYCGIPLYFMKYRKRWGILAGTFLFFLITAISCSVIWRIDVEGNHYISDEYIKEVLGEVGFSVGDKIKEKNIDIINNRFLTVSKGIRWISVNLNGTYANVEVRETDEGGTEQDGKIYNLVASEDGQIERMASIEGKPQVVINDTVEKGDVLVSGVINYHENLMRFESAKGSVFAKVSRKFDVEVPVEKEIKEYTGEQKCDRVINFFENRINLIKNSRIPYKFYDTIEKNREMTVFSQVLPISVKVTEYREYVTEKIVLNEKKAKEEALSQYRQKLTETIGRDALLSKTVNSSFDGKTYRIHCEVYCLADIAYPSEIKITERADKIGTENGKTALR